jgi:hypothetical protein
MYNNDPKYMNPQQGLASLVNSPYGDSDVMRVKMTPREVAGLQQLAMSYGANQRDLYDPVTGEPRFSFLKKILPMIAGTVLGPAGFGMSAFGAAATVGAVTGLIEGDLKKGLMAGLGAYSGAKIGEGFTAAGKAASQVSTAPPPSTLAQQLGLKESDLIAPTGLDSKAAFGVDIPDTSGPLPAVSPMQAADVVQTVTPRQAPTGFFGTMGQGVKNVFASGDAGDASRSAFMKTFENPFVRSATLMGGLAALTPEQKALDIPGADEDTFYVHGGFNPLYGTGAGQPMFLPGKHYKRTKKGVFEYNPYGPIRGAAMGGLMQAQNQQGSIPQPSVPYPKPNQNYPLSTVAQTNYAPNAPRGRELVNGYEPKIDPFTGEERFADGGAVFDPMPGYKDPAVVGTDPFDPNRRFTLDEQEMFGFNPPAGTAPGITKPGDPSQPVTTTEDPNVAANRAYVAELNRRAKNPTFTPYGSIAGGGFGGIYTGGNPYGPPLDTGGGQTTTGGGAGDVAAFLATQVGINWLMQPGNASALQNWISGGMKWSERPFLNADKTVTTPGGTTTTPGGTTTTSGGTTTTPGGTNTTPGGTTTTPGGTTTTPGGTGTETGTNTAADILNRIKNIPVYGPNGAIQDPLAGVDLTDLSGLAKRFGLKSLEEAAKLKDAYAVQIGRLDPVTGTYTYSGGIPDLLKNKIIPGVGTALGAYSTAKAIEAGKEGQAALSAAGTAASAAKLFNIGALGGPVGMAAAAALAAIGASLVNTKEYGDVALRNYWNAVDAGRGIGQTDANELAQGFINFYRTNKNEFAGQAKYGRTGNEDFLYDMTQVINNAVKDGKVNKDVDAATMYKDVVQPWLNSMGEGPKNEDARRIQDFMMTDIINSFMQGKNISNSQVKNDKKYKLVSERPVYAGAPTAQQQTPVGQDRSIEDYIRQNMQQGAVRGYQNIFQQTNPYADTGREFVPRGGEEQFLAEGGSIGEDYNFGFASGGMPEYQAGGTLLNGPGDGMSDSIPAVIRGKGVQRAALADGEFVVPADVVSHLGNGSTNAGAKKLYGMMDKIRQARTGKTGQAPAVRTDRYLPA